MVATKDWERRNEELVFDESSVDGWEWWLHNVLNTTRLYTEKWLRGQILSYLYFNTVKIYDCKWKHFVNNKTIN